jgi:non-canonical purine NTP pyrophosphatase (RdgB/HAM1 family)
VIAFVISVEHPLYGAEGGHGVERIDVHPFLKAGQQAFICHGVVEGRIAQEPEGEGGFGYDPLFYYPPANQTFATLAPEKKNAISHRANAMTHFLQWLGAVSELGTENV